MFLVPFLHAVREYDDDVPGVFVAVKLLIYVASPASAVPQI